MDAEEDDGIDKDGLRTNESQRVNDEKAKLVPQAFNYKTLVLTGITDFVVVFYLLLLPVYYDLPTF